MLNLAVAFINHRKWSKKLRKHFEGERCSAKARKKICGTNGHQVSKVMLEDFIKDHDYDDEETRLKVNTK